MLYLITNVKILSLIAKIFNINVYSLTPLHYQHNIYKHTKKNKTQKRGTKIITNQTKISSQLSMPLVDLN